MFSFLLSSFDHRDAVSKFSLLLTVTLSIFQRKGQFLFYAIKRNLAHVEFVGYLHEFYFNKLSPHLILIFVDLNDLKLVISLRRFYVNFKLYFNKFSPHLILIFVDLNDLKLVISLRRFYVNFLRMENNMHSAVLIQVWKT